MLPHWSEPPICSAQAMAPGKLDEVVGLQHHVVELEEGERLVALQPQLHRIHAQHAVDREMPADVAQQRDVEQPVEPVGVVHHDGIGRGRRRPRIEFRGERQELGEHGLDAGHVARDVRVGQQLARLVLARRIADLGRAAAHQHDRLVAGALQPAQHHDLHEAADMQAVGGAVEADIGGSDAALEALLQRLEVGYLMDEAALMDDPEEVRFRGSRHNRETSGSVQREAVFRSGAARTSAAGGLHDRGHVVVDVLRQLVELVGVEVIGAADHAVVDQDVALARQALGQLLHRIVRHDVVLVALQDQARGRAGCQEGEIEHVGRRRQPR